jgi:hypothetical protein
MSDAATESRDRRCVLCDNPAHISRDIATEDDEVVLTADLCKEHADKLKRYNGGEGVEFDV